MKEPVELTLKEQLAMDEENRRNFTPYGYYCKLCKKIHWGNC